MTEQPQDASHDSPDEEQEVVGGPIFTAAGRVYADWPAAPVTDGDGWVIDVEGTTGAWSAMALTDDHHDMFVFYSLAPVDAAPERRAALSEFLHRANYGLVTATFELDHETGESRLRTGIDLATLPRVLREDADLLDEIVRDLSAGNIEVFDRYLAGLVAVVDHGADPAEVIEEIESPQE